MRTSGILLPIASLPGKYGIGCFSREAYSFVDFLVKAKQTYWQIVPIGPISFGDSPYRSFSAFAGNPYFIDPETLISEGLLTGEECRAVDFGSDRESVDYEKIYRGRFGLLRKAYDRSRALRNKEYVKFQEENREWLDSYAAYMAIKDHFGGISFLQWPKDIKNREPEALLRYEKELAEEMEFYRFLQYKFFQQWTKLKTYANKKGIQIIGDIPLYVASDSAEAWANPELFQREEGAFTKVAGYPPDQDSPKGQRWGNPLYDWEYHKKTGFSWWIARMKHCYKLYDVVRMNHFQGFDQYYVIPAEEKTGEKGYWQAGPGMAFFDAIRKALGEVPIFADDLGHITDRGRRLVEENGFPGVKVLEFAFDVKDFGGSNPYLPYHYQTNYVVYTGTYDNETVCGWLKSLTKAECRNVAHFVDAPVTDKIGICDGLIRTAHASVADYCIIPMQDYLHLGNEARMNQQDTLGSNWRWRVQAKSLTPELAKDIAALTLTYGRYPKKKRGKNDN